MFHPLSPQTLQSCLIYSHLFSVFHSHISQLPGDTPLGCSAPTVSTTWATFIPSNFIVNFSPICHLPLDSQPCPRIPLDRAYPTQRGPAKPTSNPKLPTDVSPPPDGRVARRTTKLPRPPNPKEKNPRKRIRRSRPALLVALEKNRLRQLLLGKRPNWRLLVTKPPRGLLLLRQTPILHPHRRHRHRRSLRLRLSPCLLLKLLLLQLRLRPTHRVLIPRRRALPLLTPCRNHTRLGPSHNLRHLNPRKLLLHARAAKTSIPFDRPLITLLLRLPTVHLLSMWYHRGITIAPVHHPRSPASLTPRHKTRTLSKRRCIAPPLAMSRPYTLQRLLPRYQHLRTTP